MGGRVSAPREGGIHGGGKAGEGSSADILLKHMMTSECRVCVCERDNLERQLIVLHVLVRGAGHPPSPTRTARRPSPTPLVEVARRGEFRSARFCRGHLGHGQVMCQRKR